MRRLVTRAQEKQRDALAAVCHWSSLSPGSYDLRTGYRYRRLHRLRMYGSVLSNFRKCEVDASVVGLAWPALLGHVPRCNIGAVCGAGTPGSTALAEAIAEPATAIH